jgi:hypothetical protein
VSRPKESSSVAIRVLPGDLLAGTGYAKFSKNGGSVPAKTPALRTNRSGGERDCGRKEFSLALTVIQGDQAKSG